MPAKLADLWSMFVAGWPRAMEVSANILANPFARALGLLLIVYGTIRVIAAIYSGDKQGAELGPIAIRPHQAKRYDRNTIRLPHELMPMSMDGVSVRCRVFYVYNDAQGKRRKKAVHTIKTAKLSISPVKLQRIDNVIYGQEIPDVETSRVCFPPVDIQQPGAVVSPTPQMARDYAALHGILDAWKEDDSAVWVSLHSDVKEEIAEAKVEIIQAYAERLKRAESGFISKKLNFRGMYKNRPGAVGSYYMKFEFSHEPLFVLTRHPDRDLKMTAWLTVLTSVFAMIMEAWPSGAPPVVIPAAYSDSNAPAEVRTPRTVRPVAP